MASLSDKSVSLRRRKWVDADDLAKEIFRILKDEDGDTTTSTTSSSVASSSESLSSSSTIKEFVLTSPHYDQDYLQCTDPDGDTVYLAKPYLFRPSTWEGQVVSLNNMYLGTRFSNLTITYGSLTSDENQRTVKTRSQLVSASTDVIETIFTESILPFYKVGDKLYGINIPAGLGFIGGDGAAISWIDINADGRSWRPDASLQVS